MDVVPPVSQPPSAFNVSKPISLKFRDNLTIEENVEYSNDTSHTVCSTPLQDSSNLVCSTPLRDVNINKVLHARAVSICSRVETAELPPSKVPVADVADNYVVRGNINEYVLYELPVNQSLHHCLFLSRCAALQTLFLMLFVTLLLPVIANGRHLKRHKYLFRQITTTSSKQCMIYVLI